VSVARASARASPATKALADARATDTNFYSGIIYITEPPIITELARSVAKIHINTYIYVLNFTTLKGSLMIKKLTFTLFLFACALLAQANAQTAVAPEKKAAIKELVAIIQADNKAEDLVEIMSAQMQVTSRTIFRAMLDERTDLTLAERKSLEDSFAAGQQESAKRFQEKFLQKLDLNAVIEETSIAIYDKHYTLEEIRDLIAFYKTPTGQKAVRLMTTIMSDSMQAMQEKLLPKIPVIVKEIEEEIRKEAEEKINAKKPRPKKPAAE
jgi:hypothetical protein